MFLSLLNILYSFFLCSICSVNVNKKKLDENIGLITLINDYSEEKIASVTKINLKPNEKKDS